VVPAALLMLAVHVLHFHVLWHELRKSIRKATRRDWGLVAVSLGIAAVLNFFLIRAYEGHGRETVGLVLLIAMLAFAAVAIVGVPIAIWVDRRRRERRKRGA
jgi:4-amino-4-deoxy-L-arabinose transferase-like glycosyltransferase